MVDQVAAFRNVAEVLRAAQQVAIEVENAPELRKTLRGFTSAECAALLGLSLPELKALAARRLPEVPSGPRGRFSFAQLEALRSKALPSPDKPLRRRLGRDALATVVFTNFKGGSSKTTSSVHFAQYMALAGYRVLLVDLDSQGSATAQFGFDPSREAGADACFAAWTTARDENRTDAFDAAALCRRTYWPTIDLVPAGAALAAAEDSLTRRASAGQPEDPLYFEEFNVFLGRLPDRYDVVVVDTRPDVNMLMTNALHAASGIIVPTRASMTDLASTGEYFAHLASYAAEFAEAFVTPLPLKFARILVTAFDPTDRSQEALLALARERFGEMVLGRPFLHSRIIGTAGLGKETLYEYEPSTDRAAYQRALASTNAVNRLIEREVLRFWGRRLPAEPA
jgi:chromosome partitioning protein